MSILRRNLYATINNIVRNMVTKCFIVVDPMQPFQVRGMNQSLGKWISQVLFESQVL